RRSRAPRADHRRLPRHEREAAATGTTMNSVQHVTFRISAAALLALCSLGGRLIASIGLLAFAMLSAQAADSAKPNVRAITAFVRLDRATYEKQIGAAMKVLEAAKAEFARRGYQTQTVRIVTQPFPERIKGLSDQDALAFLKKLDDLSVQAGTAR